MKGTVVHREEQPWLFLANLIAQGLVAMFAFGLAIVALFDRKPV